MKRVVLDGIGFIVSDDKVEGFVSQGYKVERIADNSETKIQDIPGNDEPKTTKTIKKATSKKPKTKAK